MYFEGCEKIYAWFNHLVAQLALGKAKVPKGVTMRKVKFFAIEILCNKRLWVDLFEHYSVLDSPEKTMDEKPDIYEHAVSNFWESVRKIISFSKKGQLPSRETEIPR